MTELYSLELIASILERTHQEPDITDMPPDLREHRAGWFRNAAAAIRNAEAERDEITRYYDTQMKINTELRAERDALKKDAERYRAARTISFGIADWTTIAKPIIRYNENADAAIDAATEKDNG